ncbi:hypothetical protein FLM48_00315 [Shewanella sp. Scap07]|uniref:hypothetical protein n=1 Tax=Shewanella sp. Scap07 TaxID=2589987 RepID=UPI0015BBC055|nr:hypothetical protein [Shewanella sp. Scap07]QLE83665.1 hypothetical protein FLM48_00315 [Shewanella sp. Scap07]
MNYAASQYQYRYWTDMCNQYWNNFRHLSCPQLLQGATACEYMAQWREYHANQFFGGPDAVHQGYINNARYRSNALLAAFRHECGH